VIVGGGDGSISITIEKMINFGINLEYTPIGVLPFGTGNDLSRVLGWGSSIKFNNETKFLKMQSEKWINAIVDNFDLW